jgi:hypothetical protein
MGTALRQSALEHSSEHNSKHSPLEHSPLEQSSLEQNPSEHNSKQSSKQSSKQNSLEQSSYDLTVELIDEIIKKRRVVLERKIKRLPANNFRASDIHECGKYMVHTILDWDKRALHEAKLQAIFDAGNKEEENVKNRLGYELGIEFIEQQKPFEIKNRLGEVICRGHIDGKILFKGHALPAEIKSMNQNIFSTINSVSDFNKKPLHRKYLRQLQLYLYGNNEWAGMFILSDFRNEKLFPVGLDLGECEHIIGRLEANWEYVKKKEYPKPIEYTDNVCGVCAFKHICQTDVKHNGIAMIENPELEEKLERLQSLKVTATEYKELEEELKEPFKRQKLPEVFLGTNWIIKTKVQKSIGIDTKAIPDDVKQKYQKETERITVNFIRI